MPSFLNPIKKNGVKSKSDEWDENEKKNKRKKSVSLSVEKKLIQHQADNPSVYFT